MTIKIWRFVQPRQGYLFISVYFCTPYGNCTPLLKIVSIHFDEGLAISASTIGSYLILGRILYY